MPIRSVVVAAVLLVLSGCDSPKESYGYNFEPFEITDDEWVGRRTFAECESGRYKEQYLKKKAELKNIYDRCARIPREEMAEIVKQERDFEKFIESYAEKNSALYCRSGYYHYYGALIDMIDLRIKHLKIHISQFGDSL
jgi:hypothetical protein